VDSSLFNDPANKTYNNRKEAEKALYTGAVMPNMNKLETGLNRWLVPGFFPGRMARLRVDYSNITALQEDFHQKVQSVVSMKTSGIITANRAAEMLNQPNIEEENADKLLATVSDRLLETLGGKDIAENPQLETLRGLSPLVANRILDNLSDEEVRRLLGL
jgi:phage portal protein BeeE